MRTISERIFDGTLDGIPLDIVLEIGEEIDRLISEENNPLEQAVYVATGRTVKKYAGEVPAANGRGRWFETCLKIGEEVYGMCILRYHLADSAMIQKQALAAAYRGAVDKIIEKIASIKAKNYAIDED